MFIPQTVACLRNYTQQQFFADVTAGVVVGIVALPLALAFAIACGLPPQMGLYTAIVAGFLISLLGGSRVQIGGPTGAFVVIIAGIVQRHPDNLQAGINDLTICTIMAGFMLIALGLARLGGAIKFIPYPVITGFTSGIAVIIFSGQVKDLLGLDKSLKVPGEFLHKWAFYFDHLESVNWWAIGLSALCIGIIAFWPKRLRRVPGSVVAMILATVLVSVFQLPVDTIGSCFPPIPSQLPTPSFPEITFDRIRELMAPAATVALLAGIESLLSAVVADGMTGHRHKSNMELIAQGVANIVAPIFGGFSATGAIARTATNIKNGASTPVAGMVHALTLLLIMMLFGRWASLIPMCSLASVLVVVSYNMSEWRSFRALLSAPRSDVAVLLTTFILTVVFDLTLAVQVGVVLAAFLFMKRMADVTRIGKITRSVADARHQEHDELDADKAAIGKRSIPAGVEVYEVYGPFFFGAAEKVREVLNVVGTPPKVLILRMRHVPVIDATGLHALEEVFHGCGKAGTTIVLCAVHEQPLRALHRSKHLEKLGEQNLTANIDRALDRAREILGLKPEVPTKRMPAAVAPSKKTQKHNTVPS